MIYNLIGRIVVRSVVLSMKTAISPRTATIAAVGVLAGLAAVAAAGYLAGREVPEA